MSNKTRLQTNNTNLQELINKANALPDAGSGGSGGGSVEMCTLTIYADSPMMGNEEIWYSDGSSTPKDIIFPEFGDSTTVNVVKNSIIFADVLLNVSGNMSRVTGSPYVYFISGDAMAMTM